MYLEPAAKVRNPPITPNAAISNSYSRQRSRLYINLGLSLSGSPARLRVSQVRTALRSVAHSAMRPHRGVAPGIPVCPPREHVAPRPLRRIALRSVFPRAKRSRRSIRLPRPVAPFACSGRANLPSKHTHMSVEAYPPDGPQISPPQGSQNFSARAVRVLRAVQCVKVCALLASCPENFCARQAGGCAVPDPGRFGNQTFGHATTLTWWSNLISGEQTWLTIKRTPTRPSSFSG